TSPALLPVGKDALTVALWPGARFSDDGLTVPNGVYADDLNSKLMLPVNAGFAHTIAFHLPGAGYRASICAKLPSPCGQLYAVKFPNGSTRARNTMNPSFAPFQAMEASSRSAPGGTFTLRILNARGAPWTFGKVTFGSSVTFPVLVDSTLVSDRVLSETCWVPREAFCTVKVRATVPFG